MIKTVFCGFESNDVGEDTGIKIRSIVPDHFFPRERTKEWNILKIPFMYLFVFYIERLFKQVVTRYNEWSKGLTSQSDCSIFSKEFSWYF